MTQDRQYEARETLVWLRGPQYDVDKELKDTAQQLESENNANLSFLEKIKEFRKRSVLRPVIVAVILMFFQQCSGVTGIFFNAEDIFKEANIKSPGLLSSVTIGGTQMVATFLGKQYICHYHHWIV